MIRKASSRWLTLVVIIITSLIGCHKSSSLQGPAAVNIINAIPGSQPLIPVLGTTAAIPSYLNAANVPYGMARMYTPLGGSTTIYIVQDAVGDTIAPEGHGTGVFSGAISFAPYGIYSFFLARDTVSADTMLVRDQIPTFTDSSAGVRFVNLSAPGQVFAVNIEGGVLGSEMSALPYKGITSFIPHPGGAGPEAAGYLFVIRDQGGDSLTSFLWMPMAFKSNTLVITGSPDSTGVRGLSVFAVNNY